jgi:hypothetical protein
MNTWMCEPSRATAVMRWCWPLMTVVVCYELVFASFCIEQYLNLLCTFELALQLAETITQTQWSRCWKTCFYATPMAHLNSEHTYWNSWTIERYAYYAAPRGSYTMWSIITRTGCSIGLWSSLHGLAIETLGHSKQSHHFAVLSQ